MWLACAGHWYVSGLYLAPVAVLVIALKLSAMREGGRERDERDELALDRPGGAEVATGTHRL